MRVCACVERRVFRSCLQRFYRERQRTADGMTYVTYSGWRFGVGHFARKSEEYQADFVLTARRELTDELDWQIMRRFHLDGSGYGDICPRLGLERGYFYSRLYLIEARLGRAFFSLSPYPLFPMKNYFGGGR